MYETIFQKYSMKHILATTTDLMNWEKLKFCKLSCGKMVIFGRKLHDPEHKGPGFYIYSNKGIKLTRLEDLCHHDDPVKNVLTPFTTSSDEYVLIVCPLCKILQLLDISERRFLKAYENQNATFGPACIGPPNTLYFIARKRGLNVQSLFILETQSKRFNEQQVLNTEINGNISALVSDSRTDRLFLLENDSQTVYSVSSKTGKTCWVLQKSLNGVPYLPKSVSCYSPEDVSDDSVIITTNGTDKLMVFSAQDGTYKQELIHEKITHPLAVDYTNRTVIVQQERDNIIELLSFELQIDSI